MKTGDYVKILDAKGSGVWCYAGRKGHIVEADKYCYSVRTDGGELIRDVKEHFEKIH